MEHAYPGIGALQFQPSWLERYRYVGFLGLTLGLTALDYSFEFNVSIAYLLPLVLWVLFTRRPVPWMLPALLIVLTLMVYFTKWLPDLDPGLPRLYSYRLINRVIVLAVVITVTMLSRPAARRLRAWQSIGGELPAEAALEVVFAQLETVLVAMLSIGLLLLIVAADLLAPTPINLPILYAVPLLLAAWTMSQRLVWTLAPFAAIFPFIDYIWTSQAQGQWLPTFILVNRLLACVISIGTAVGISVWVWHQHRRMHCVRGA